MVTLSKRLNFNESFKAYIKKLDKKKPVIVCGDMNVAHNEIDLKNPKTNKKNAGFTQVFFVSLYISTYIKTDYFRKKEMG